MIQQGLSCTRFVTENWYSVFTGNIEMFYNFGEYKLGLLQKISIQFSVTKQCIRGRLQFSIFYYLKIDESSGERPAVL